MVRRKSGGLEHLPALFSDDAAGRLRLRPRERALLFASRAAVRSFGAVGGGAGDVADRAVRQLETGRQRLSDRRESWRLLAACVGPAFFVLSSTGPLVQAWFSRALPGRSPYRLYSLSNVGSLLALLSYPFVVEPALDGAAQSLWWSVGFVLFVVLCGTACWLTARLRHGRRCRRSRRRSADLLLQSTTDEASFARAAVRLGWRLPAFASMLLPATTNHVCQDVASIPFLWVMPLSLYLLSFIIAFDHERWYRRLPYGAGRDDRHLFDRRHVQPRRLERGLAGNAAPPGFGAGRRANGRCRSACRWSWPANSARCFWSACSATASCFACGPRRAI